jgi:DNA-binding response OmpR family regulator
MSRHELEALSVLVLEDDYFLAHDAKDALERAGARVVGPYHDAAQAIAEVDREKPNCALVDVNLGRGPNFAPARALIARGVPVAFLTGYDIEALPDDLADMPWLQKPINEGGVVSAVQTICGRP